MVEDLLQLHIFASALSWIKKSGILQAYWLGIYQYAKNDQTIPNRFGIFFANWPQYDYRVPTFI